jgi:hypothetical protein
MTSARRKMNVGGVSNAKSQCRLHERKKAFILSFKTQQTKQPVTKSPNFLHNERGEGYKIQSGSDAFSTREEGGGLGKLGAEKGTSVTKVRNLERLRFSAGVVAVTAT